MKIVVTGALGHIGSRLIRELPLYFPSPEIVMVDNLLTQRYSSLFNLPDGAKFQFLQEDILKTDLRKIFTGARAVVHLAAITDAAGSFGNEEEIEKVNYVGTEMVARACSAVSAPLIFLSTTSIYGSTKSSIEENCDASDINPQSPYADSKFRSERFLAQLAAEEKFDYVIARFGTIFGVSPGMRFHTAVNKFVWQACNGKPITVWKTAMEQRRPYLDLGDAVRALVFIMQKQLFGGEVYNILTLNASVRQIIDAIENEVPQIEVQLVDSKVMNELSYNVLCRKFESLGFTFKGDLPQAVAETVALLKNVRHL